DAKVNKRAQDIEIFGRRGNDLRLIVGSTATAINRYPNVFQTQQRRFTFSQHRGSEYITIKRDRTSYVGDDQRYRHYKFCVGIFCLHAYYLILDRCTQKNQTNASASFAETSFPSLPNS